jgi:uncharacterized protein YkwD
MILAFLLLLAPVASNVESNEINTANVIALMNEYRAEKGLPPLSENARLAQAAQDRMRHMEELGYWSHNAPDGMSPFVWLMARDYSYRAAAENLASGFETARLLVDAWMESPGHRDNIMGADFEHCGIAIIEGSTMGPATGKSIVVLFGAPQRMVTAAKQP